MINCEHDKMKKKQPNITYRQNRIPKSNKKNV